MINKELLRKNPKLLASQLWRRMFFLKIKNILYIEKIRKFLQIRIEKLQFKYKNILKNYHLINIIKNYKNLIKKKYFIFFFKKIQMQLKYFKKNIQIITSFIPNIPDMNIPYGNKYENNKEIKKWGIINNKKIYKNYMQLKKNNLHWKSAIKITGSKFILMTGKIALLHRALGQFMLDIHVFKHGYKETYVPYLVNKTSLYCTGQLPKFNYKLFHISSIINKENFSLIPTGEIPLTNYVRNTITLKNKLPIMLTAHTPCFRLESKSYGLNAKGLIRMHQFDKVELVQMVTKKKSFYTLEILTKHAEKILQMLKLPYRKILLCAGELSFSSSKTYDLEVWFPAQKKYKEVSSCSNILNFQSRRMYAYYYNKNNKKKFLHTLNGSGLAVGRVLAAILENYQDKYGNIKIPDVLSKKYMNGLKII